MLAGGCGGEDEPAVTTTASPAGTQAPPPAASPTPPPGRTGPVPGGERDATRPALLRLGSGRFVPTSTTVQPFLALRLTIRSADGRRHIVTVHADATYRLDVPASGTASLIIPGQPPGRYRIESGDARATLIVGAES